MTDKFKSPDPSVSSADITSAPPALLSIEDRVDDIWRRTLGPKLQGPDKHILRVGIGLRRLVRLLQELKGEFDVEIRPTAVMRLGTARALSEAIRHGAWPDTSPFLLLADGDQSPPLYILAAGSGLILELCELAQLIDYPGQIWAVQPPGLDGEATPFDNVHDLARFYHDAIIARQPAGPYHLLGYSFGGLVIVEIARLLAGSNRTVGLLGLIDSNVEEKFWPKAVWLAEVAKRALKRATYAFRLPPKEAAAYITARALGLLGYVRNRLNGATTASEFRSVYYIGGLEPAFQSVRDAAITAFEAYRPSRLELKATLFKSEHGDPHACNPILVWRRLFRELDVTIVPGTHETMVRPPLAKTLAAEISARLRRDIAA